MKHKHYDMICEKAANMDLILFRKTPSSETWETCRRDWMPTDLQDEYFLCLPQHKDACLHWLNGHEIEIRQGYSQEWEVYGPVKVWSIKSIFMKDYHQSRVKPRIKPRKERLWLAVKTDKHEHLGGCRKVRICSHAFVNKSDAEEYLDLSDSQLIEIEVEV